MPDLAIRAAAASDLRAINDIYNHFVTHSTCTYQEEPDSLRARQAWFAAHGGRHPVVVATEGDLVVGWGALSPFHVRSAYGRTVEDSIYVHHAHHRRGIGRALLVDLIARARVLGHHTVIALIDAEQAGSIALHENAGFSEVGQLREVGFKFGRWLHVRYLQLML